MESQVQQVEVAEGTGTVPVDSSATTRDETETALAGNNDGNDSAGGVLLVQREPVSDTVLSSGSDNGNESVSQATEIGREPVERVPTTDSVECDPILQTQAVAREQEKRQQVVVNLTTLEVHRVVWDNYPSLGESGGYDVAQVMMFKPNKGWVILVPVLSGEINEILFSPKHVKFSLVAVVEALAGDY